MFDEPTELLDTDVYPTIGYSISTFNVIYEFIFYIMSIVVHIFKK